MNQQILQAFALEGQPVSCEPFGNGHINSTYRVRTDTGGDYILQCINHQVFQRVPELMENVVAVTAHLAKKDPDPRHVLTLVFTREGKSYLEFAGEFYRMCLFAKDSMSIDRAESPEDFYLSAVAFGDFARKLSDFPAHTLHETIPHFHDTPARYDRFREAIRQDPLGRAALVRPEIDFALARAEAAGEMVGMQQAGTLPLRVTHNDTKLNNVLFDIHTRKPICVVDLDTVMPGLTGNDFGDSIRFGASTAAEDEQDLSKVEMSLELYNAYLRGFLEACGDSLTKEELRTLPLGAKLMTLECGTRFLTDYLMGDTYFRIHREGQNLDRCRTQYKLVADMENKWEAMRVKA